MSGWKCGSVVFFGGGTISCDLELGHRDNHRVSNPFGVQAQWPNNPEPAAGTSLWRIKNHPDSMQEEDWQRLAYAYVDLREVAQNVVDACGYWESDGKQRVSWPTDRDGASEPETDALMVALRDLLAQ